MIIRWLSLFAFSVFGVLLTGVVWADPILYVGHANDNPGISAWELGYKQHGDPDWVKNLSPNLHGFWEAKFHYWQREKDNVLGLALLPGLEYQWHQTAIGSPYAQLAFGVAVINDRKIGFRDMSTNWQFETMAGFGTRFGERDRYDLNLSFVHLSNADINEPNFGIDLLTLSFGADFDSF